MKFLTRRGQKRFTLVLLPEVKDFTIHHHYRKLYLQDPELQVAAGGCEGPTAPGDTERVILLESVRLPALRLRLPQRERTRGEISHLSLCQGMYSAHCLSRTFKIPMLSAYQKQHG